MSIFNKVQIIGIAASNPIVSKTKSGLKVELPVMVTTELRDKDGEVTTKTQIFITVGWGKVAETISKYISKNSDIATEGKLYVANEAVRIELTDVLLIGK